MRNKVLRSISMLGHPYEAYEYLFFLMNENYYDGLDGNFDWCTKGERCSQSAASPQARIAPAILTCVVQQEQIT